MELKIQQENFNKALLIYLKKYALTVISLFQFIDYKIHATQQLKKIIKTQILKHVKLQSPLNIEKLTQFFHLIAAAQSKVNIVNAEIKMFQNQYQLIFVSSKLKDSKSIKQSVKPENKKPLQMNRLLEQGKGKEQKMKNQNLGGKGSEALKIQEKEIITRKKQEQSKNNVQAIKIEQRKTNFEKINTQNKNKYQSNAPQNTSEKQLDKKTNQNKKSPSKQANLYAIQQNINDSLSSSLDSQSKTQEYMMNHPSVQMMKIQSSSYVQIVGYDKFGQNYLNPIIKFHILYGQNSVYRRYSQFQNLMNDLSIRYQGYILPELPPKEGIKSNLSYFRGIDQAFLNERQSKLQDMINFLLNSKVIKDDQILQKFLKEQDFQISNNNSDNSTLSYLKSITTIAFNAKQLKSYGLAYYSYIKQFKKEQISTEVVNKYKEIENLLNLCLTLDNHRNSINNNFQQRRQIFKDLKSDQNDRNLVITKFDKASATTASQIRNLNKQFNKYLELKSQQSWLNYLIKQKENELQSELSQLKRNKDDITVRISKMEDNLLVSIDDIERQKVLYLQQVSQKTIQWRKSIHP